ncbi:MAG: thioether cross-link-forming SCIFF peptide maturase [Catonella sp.]|nr:thioether cross-link-forming SCIFF peptide maturase [Catonella sp.]
MARDLRGGGTRAGADAGDDVNSGGVHIVDELTYDLLDNVEPPFDEKCPQKAMDKLSKVYQPEDIESCYQEIVELYNDKILFSEDDYEKYANVSVASPIKAMCLNIAHDCQLRCKYCFASTGDFGKGRKLMSFETGKHAIDFLLEKSGDRQNLELDFFGGEPLMNWEVVKKLVAYGRSQEKEKNKNFRFTITTNGLLLNDEIIDFCNKEMTNVVLSIDGRREVNDRMRPTRNGNGSSYDIILPKYKDFAKKRGDREYYLRGTFTHYNLDFAEDVLHLADMGFKELSMEPVVALPSDPYAIKEEDVPVLIEQYDKLAKEYVKRRKDGRGFTFFHFMIDLSGGPCVAKRLAGCGSGTEYLAVTPWGDLYPCHQFVGEEKFVLGNVWDGITNTEVQEGFKHQNVYEKPKCRDCFARYYCSGGCAANSYKFHGTIDDAYDIGCELQRKRIECAIMIKAALDEDADEAEEAEQA